MDAKFFIGQVIHHKLFDYRGVIIDADPQFTLSEEWYQLMAKSSPPKDKPWYRILVHNSNHETYVAEQNLEQDISGEPVAHPDLACYLGSFNAAENRYELKQKRSN